MNFRLFPSQQRVGARRVPRALAVVLLAFQALLWGGGTIVEAQAAAESLTQRPHVEDQGRTGCPPIHSHINCLICRTLSGGSTGATPATLMWVDGSPGVESWRLDGVTLLDRGLHGTLGSRGPPASLSVSAPRT
jgi:hypothetical protein